MSRFAYVNGQYIRHNEASVHIEDRGFQFADSVYEVVYVYEGRMIDAEPHLDRLERSLDELQMEMPMERGPLRLVMKEMVRRNKIKTGLIYMQVSRGSAPRDFPFPLNCLPTLVMTAKHTKPYSPQSAQTGIRVMSTPDIRWKRCDIKTVSLLAAALAKQEAIDNGFDDAWLIDEQGFVTEGTSNNAWIVNKNGHLQTRKPTHEILNGITRRSVMALAQKEGIEVLETSFTLEDVKHAREAFVTSASACVKPVVSIDGASIGSGQPGPVSQKLAASYIDFLKGTK